MTQFGRGLGDDLAKLTQVRNKIVEEVAERDWQMGQYYDNQKYFRSARFYYNAVIETHPRSQAAAKAKTRLIEIRDEPDVPVNRFQWLTDMFADKD